MNQPINKNSDLLRTTIPHAVAGYVRPLDPKSVVRASILFRQNNITRSAYHALAAVLGGAQSVHIDGYDEALCTPTETSALIALRAQQILQHETNVTSTVDPLGGSYFVESLTNDVERRVREYLTKIEKLGGIVEATDKGWIHEEIADSAMEYQKAVESGERLVVGVNCYAMDDQPVEIFVQPETLNRQKAKLAELRRRRDATLVRATLDGIREACKRMDNVMPSVIEAARAWATVGEIAQVFRDEWGSWDPPLRL